MFVSENLSTNEQGNLTIGGVDTTYLAKKYGTPLYVLDEDLIIKNCLEYKNAIDEFYNCKGLVLYASKAFSSIYIYKLIASLGLGTDVVSGGELYTALKAGFDASKIYFHGNNKTDEELTMALSNNVGRIVIDNEEELIRLNNIAEKMNKTQKILFRIKPGIDAHTHDCVKTGQIDSKFGFAIFNGEAFDVLSKLSSFKNLEFAGIHCHIGSQIFDAEPFLEAARVMLNFSKTIKDKLSLTTAELNLGGGFGIKYVNADDPINFKEYIELVSKEVYRLCDELDLAIPFILMEPGRSIVASAGITLYTVGSIKQIKDVRNYLSVDGGMTDNPRYALYRSVYESTIANRATEQCSDFYRVVGKCCESGDILIDNAHLPKALPGDILAIFATGAYNYSMSSNYNRILKPAVVAVSKGDDKLVVKRETYEDIIRNDVI